MGKYTLVVTDTGNDIGTLTGQTLSLGVLSGSGPKGDGFTGGSYDDATKTFTFTSNDGLGFTTDPIVTELSGDTTPQLGGNLDLNSSDITGTGNIDITGNITATGYLRGPSTFTIDPAAHGDNTGTVVIAGNLQVDGTQTVINSTTMTVDDLNVTLASGAANAAAADGAGITVDGASASITYGATGDAWQFSKDIDTNGNDITFGDNDKAIFGAGSDLQIYHDGSNSFIEEAGTGNLIVAGSTEVKVRDTPFGSNFAVFKSGAVDLYASGTKRLATTSTGVDITGTLTSDGLTVDGASADLAVLNYTDSGAGQGPNLFLRRTSSTPANNDALGSLIYQGKDSNANTTSMAEIKAIATNVTDGSETASLNLRTRNGSSGQLDRLKIDGNGDISFYEDTGTTAKFFWDASEENLGIGGASTFTSGTNIEVMDSNVARLGFTNTSANGSQWAWYSGTSGQAALYDYDNSAQRITINSSGNVGIGTSSPVIANGTGLVIDGGSSTARLELKTSGTSGGTTSDGAFVTFNNTNMFIGNRESGTIQFSNAGSERLRIDSSGNVGIGTSSPAAALHVEGKGFFEYGLRLGNSYSAIDVETGASGLFLSGSQGALNHVKIDSSGRVGIGTSSPSQKLHVKDSSTNAYARITATTNTGIDFGQETNGNGLINLRDSAALRVFTGGSEAARFDASGNLLVGQSSSTAVGAGNTTTGFSIRNDGGLYVSRTSGKVTTFNRNTSDGTITEFRKDGSTVGSIGTDSGDLTVGNLSGHTGIRFATNALMPTDSGTISDGTENLGSDTYRWKDLYLSGGLHGDTTFKNNAGTTEYARFDASGNFLVGMTTPSNLTTGFAARANSLNSFCRDTATTDAAVLAVNKKTGDGDIVIIQKDGTTVGRIGTGSNGFYIVGDTASSNAAGLAFVDGSPDRIIPCSGTGASLDNNTDLGESGTRFDDIYATNGTIQTSDQNEKQDIAELTDAEQRVAVAAKGLLRKFRWKDAVAEKGDEARTHFGIIAQDLQAAFAAEGLDAGDYAMFIHTTWTDEETGEERSRMGVRYSELLAFIIAAI